MTKSRSSDAWFVFLLVLLGGNPALDALFDAKYSHALVAIALAISLRRRGLDVLGNRLPWIVGMFLGISAIQALDFGIPYITLLGFGTRLFIGCAVIRLVDDFPLAYVRVMYLLSVYAVCIWFVDQMCQILGLGFREVFEPLADRIGAPGEHWFVLFYTFTLEQVHRNAAFFREPGLFAGYLLLGLLFLSLRGSDVEASDRKRLRLVLLVALATTLSTAGYITAPLVLAAAALRNRRSSNAVAIRRFVAILIAAIVAVWFVSNHTDFIADKIAEEYESMDLESRGFEVTRFGAVLFDFEAIAERPVFGWGIDTATKFALTPEFIELGISPSGGVTGWARSFGIVGLLILIGALWSSVRLVAGGTLAASAYTTFVLLVIAQPNAFLNYPLFLGIMFLPETGAGRSAFVRDHEVAAIEP